MHKKSIILVSLLLLIIVPISFAADNETLLSDDGNVSAILLDNPDVLSASNDYYFNASALSDGDGSPENPYKYLTADRIKSNSNIYLADGEYQLDKSKSIDKVNIYGSNVERTIIKYEGMGFTVSGALTIRNVTFLDMSITNHGDITANNTVFSYGYGSRSDSYGNNYGGAIYSDESYSNAHVTIGNCTFFGNFAVYGGAIYMGNGYLEVIDTVFDSNMAYNYGGAIACENAKGVSVLRSKFYNSKSVDDAGGAIYLRSTTFTGRSIEISNSSATFGSAIASLKSSLSLTAVTCVNNTAKWDGGAVYQIYGDVSITSSRFINNSARSGGALFIDNATSCYIISNSFINNSAAHTAGAIYSLLNKLTNPLQLKNIFTDNHAYYMDDIFDTSSLDLTIGSGNYTMYRTDSLNITVLPSSYSLYDEGYVTSVKDQQSGGNCWAFAAIAVLESCILKAGGDVLDLSEENMKNLMALYSDYGWNIDVNEGGYDSMQWGYLTSWLGPVLEIDDLDDDKSALSPILNSIMHVQNILFLKRDNYTDNDAIKRAIMQYGAVGTGIAYYGSYMSGINYYCYSTMACNHEVTIVGWDDNYSKSHFKSAGSIGDGAWIVKNSWGSSWANKGYFYVSYYDVNFIRTGVVDGAFTIILNDTIRYDKNYQYDIPGPTDYFLNSSSSVWYKNVFTATDNEYLAAVSTYFEKITNWTVSIYVNGDLLLVREGKSNPGYYTIDLNQLIALKAGDVFEVVFNINVDGEAAFPISEKYSLNKKLYSPGVSYLSYDGENWQDLYELSWTYSSHWYVSQVACIKAFTILDEIGTDLKLEISFDGGNPANITAVVHDQYGNPLRSGEVTFNVNEQYYRVNVEGGIARIPYYFINTFNNIYAAFEGVGYISSVNYSFFEIEKLRLDFDFNIERSLNNVALEIIANDPITCEALLTVNDREFSINFVTGRYFMNLTDLENGLYNITLKVDFPQESIYINQTSSASFVIDIKNTIIAADDIIINDEDNLDYNITLFDEMGNPLSNRTVEMILDGKTYNATTDINGQAVVSLKLAPGNYTADISFNGDNDYLSSSKTTTIKVKCKIDVALDISRYANNVTLNIIISKAVNDTVTLTINNKSQDIKINNGRALYELFNLDNGYYDVNVSLNDADYVFNECSSSFIVDVKNTHIIAGDVIMADEDGLNYTIVLLDEFNNTLENKSIIFELDGKTYNLTTDANGCVTVLIKLNFGVYKSHIYFNGDSDYFKAIYSTDFTVKTKIEINLTAEKYADTAAVTVRLSKRITGFLTLVINNQNKTLKVVNGAAKFKLSDLENGNYTISVLLDEDTYIFNNATASFTVDVKHTQILVNDLITNDENPINYALYLVDSEGIGISGKSLEVLVNETLYDFVTDGDGLAIIPLALKAGTYSLNVAFKGGDDYLKSSNSSTITVKSLVNITLTVNKFANNVTLTADLSKAINNTLTFCINDESFDVDVVGDCAFLELADLDNGVYDVSVLLDRLRYDFNDVKDSFVIDVKGSVILVDDLVVNDEDLVNYTIALTDNMGNPVFNRSLKVIIGEDCYNLTTDDSGEAVLPIRLGSGSYDVNVVFEGDDSYFKSDNHSSILVKSKVSIDLSVDKFANNVTLSVNLSKAINDTLAFCINGESFDVDVVGDCAFLELSDLDNGVYDVSILLNNLSYDFNNVSDSFVIDVRGSVILVDDLVVNDEDLINYTIVLTDDGENPVSNRSVKVIIGDDCYNLITDSSGKAVLPIKLSSGSYDVNVVFEGDDSYFKSSNSSSIRVKSKVSIDLAIDRFANNVTLSVNLSKAINDTLTFCINDGSFDVNVVGDCAFLELSDLDNGVYDVSVLLNNLSYDFNSVSDSFIIDVKGSVILVDDLVVNDEDLVNYMIVLADDGGNPVSNRLIKVIIGDEGYNLITDINGKSILPIKLSSGSYDVNVVFEGDDSYFKSSNSSSIRVKTKVSIDLAIDRFANNVTLSVNLSKAINDTLTLTINGQTHRIYVNGKDTSLRLYNLENDVYNVNVSLNENYDYDELNDHFAVDVRKSNILASDLIIVETNSCIFNAILADEYGNPISNRLMAIKLNGNEYLRITDENGLISILFNLTSGLYDVESVFDGDNNYFKSSAINKIKVKSIINISVGYGYLLNDYMIYINSSNPEPVTFTVNVNNQSYFVNVSDGTGVLSFGNLSNGAYNVEISLSSTEDYFFEAVHSQFIINTMSSKIISSDLIAYHNIENAYFITLTDINGNPLANRSVLFTLNGIKTWATTDGDGIASVVFKLPAGEYDVSARYSGDIYEYYSSENSGRIYVKSTIIANASSTKTYGSVYGVKLLNGDGNPLVNAEVTYVLGNVEYVRTTDSQGRLNVSIAENPGSYALKIINPISGETFNEIINVVSRITQNKDLIMYEYGGNYFKVLVLDDDGNAVGAGKTVQMKIKGITYEVKTSSNGYASLKITLKNGKYTVITSYNGFKVSNRITVKPVLTAKNISVKKGKTIKFQAKLVSTKGKALINKKITFKFKGKKYTAKTNKNGIATLKLNLKLKVGSYKIYTTYGKSKVTNTIKIKK